MFILEKDVLFLQNNSNKHVTYMFVNISDTRRQIVNVNDIGEWECLAVISTVTRSVSKASWGMSWKGLRCMWTHYLLTAPRAGTQSDTVEQRMQVQSTKT